MTIGAIAPSARYSAATSSRSGAPDRCGSRLRPSSGPAMPGGSPSWARPAGREERGRADDQRHAGRVLEEAHLVPRSALAEHLPVVAGDDDDGAFESAGVAQDADQPGGVVVDIGDRAVVGPPRGTDLVFG